MGKGKGSNQGGGNPNHAPPEVCHIFIHYLPVIQSLIKAFSCIVHFSYAQKVLVSKVHYEFQVYSDEFFIVKSLRIDLKSCEKLKDFFVSLIERKGY